MAPSRERLQRSEFCWGRALIFLAVGTQLPFDRLVRTVDIWAAQNAVKHVVAQIGSGGYRPQYIPFQESIPPREFSEYQHKADLLISHAGMGAILTAQVLGKPLIIMPRLSRLNEHRNDHQLATVEQFRDLPGIHVANDESALKELLMRSSDLVGAEKISPYASPQLLDELRRSFSNRKSARSWSPWRIFSHRHSSP